MTVFSLQNKKIFVAGHRGMVGGAICRALQSYDGVDIVTRSRSELDLMDGMTVESFFQSQRPQVVFVAAAKVGGIYANDVYSGAFIYENLTIQNNIIHNAYMCGVEKLVFLGSSCIYPKMAVQPITEDSLLTGALEPTNDAYAVAKIAGIKMCQAYRKQYGFDAISVMPCNLYGYGDNYHPENSHVLPALIRRFHEAKVNSVPTVSVWGTGAVCREFLFSEDAGASIVFLAQHYSSDTIINAGSGYDISIQELAETIADVVGYTGDIVFDTTKPDGTPKKLMDSTRITKMGWHPKYDLKQGISLTYKDFLDNHDV